MNTRVVENYRQHIHATPEVVFPLLCPVREREWLDGWSCELIHSTSGVAEPGCVFRTPGDGEPDTVWLVSNRDEAEYTIQFVRFTPELRTCVLDIAVRPAAAGTSHVEIRYIYTALSKAGEDSLESLTGEAFLQAVRFWEASMNHWLMTGEILPHHGSETATGRSCKPNSKTNPKD